MPSGTAIVNQCLLSTGSTWATKEELIEFMKNSAGHMSDIEQGVQNGSIVTYQGWYSTKHFADCEDTIAMNIMRIQYVRPAKKYPPAVIRKLVHDFETEKNHGRKLHIQQVDAVVMVVNNNVSVLTGGPGTGKTTVLSAITYVLRKLRKDEKIIFTAPTGKAAKRITESTNETAHTLHKQFGIYKGIKKAVPFYQDVLFIDESSMNDVEISALLFDAVENGRKVVFVGDVDQLLSVRPGAVLRDLIRSRVIPVTKLTKTFRQDNDSVLFQNIVNIRNGVPELIEGKDFHPILLKNGSDQDAVAEDLICKKYMEAVSKYGKENVVVLIPYRRNGVCSNKMNNKLQDILNPQKKKYYQYTNENEHNTIFFKEDDYVMQLDNRDECVNGDIGRVKKVSAEGVLVEYLDNDVLYSHDELSQLALAYAMSIHKAQGSEYKSVIMCLLDSHKAMLQRNMIYTGVTRAKEECTLIYQKDAYETAIKIQAEKFRRTLLAEKLRTVRNQYRIVYGI